MGVSERVPNRFKDVVDIDEFASWPADVLAYADLWAKRLRGSTRYPADLVVPLEEAEDFRRLFAGYLLRGIHCTRLLDHERTWILEQGLRVASGDLIEERIRGACTSGTISEVERDALLGTHALAGPLRAQHQARAGQVCLIGSRTTLDRDPGAVAPLLSTWGGEVIYMPVVSHDRARLRAIGKPALVIAALDIAADPEPKEHRFSPELNRVFVARRLGLAGGVDVFYRAPVLQDHVLGIEQPGDAGYDRHRGLPAT